MALRSLVIVIDGVDEAPGPELTLTSTPTLTPTLTLTLTPTLTLTLTLTLAPTLTVGRHADDGADRTGRVREHHLCRRPDPMPRLPQELGLAAGREAAVRPRALREVCVLQQGPGQMTNDIITPRIL